VLTKKYDRRSRFSPVRLVERCFVRREQTLKCVLKITDKIAADPAPPAAERRRRSVRKARAKTVGAKLFIDSRPHPAAAAAADD